jgi:formylglycine-generating enzyme required for sulfatase activity
MATTAKQRRYPGVVPFQAHQSHLFFGREEDIENLYDLILLEKMVVLFGKSGYGKSSLLNAGVLPRFAAAKRAAEQFRVVEVRFTAWTERRAQSPLDTLRRLMGAKDADNPPTLWECFRQQNDAPDGRFLLVFDQFEEFFTYPPEEQRAFRRQLAELLFSTLPQSLRERLDALPEAERGRYLQPLQVKAVFSIRADRMSLLDGLKDALPTILHRRYELAALDRRQARAALVEPARAAGDFASAAFSWTDAALARVLDTFARDKQGREVGVEAFLLQVLAQNVETRVLNGALADRDGDGTPDVYPDDLPDDLSNIFSEYYQNKLEELPPADQPAARLLIEDGLVFASGEGEARRLSMDADVLMQRFGAAPALLRALEDTFLVRREANSTGGYHYELSHDTLLAPVVAARKAREAEEAERRRAAEEAAERERLRVEAERQRAEQRRIEAARRRNLIMGLGALALLVFAFYQTRVAQQAQQKAREMTELASKNEAMAADKTTEAETNLRKAEAEQEKARRALEDLDKQAVATEAQKRIARQNLAAADRALAQARAATADVVASLLEKARNEVLHLEYENARATLLKAAALGQLKTEVIEALYEIAFVDYHTGQTVRADSLAGVIATGLGAEKRQVLASFEESGRASLPRPLTTLAAAMHTRYFGTMIPIEGGSFDLKKYDYNRDNTIFAYRATVSPFRMAVTETTWWQYHLFCRATGYEMPEKPVGWGGEGDNPVLNVSWYDAVVYANWRSEKAGLQPAYKIDTAGKKSQSDWIVTPIWEGRAGAFRLPTEAEWQYAATNRGRDDYAYAGSDSLELVGWYYKNSGGRSRPVQRLQANVLGLYDMSGNVWEWCWDWYGDYPTKPTNDWRGPDRGEYRVRRGGSWGSSAEFCRAAGRNDGGPANRNDNVGFRLCSFSLQLTGGPDGLH